MLQLITNTEYNMNLIINLYFPFLKQEKIYKKTLIPSKKAALEKFNTVFKDFKFINFDELNHEESVSIIKFNQNLIDKNKKEYNLKMEEFYKTSVSNDMGYSVVETTINSTISNNNSKKIDIFFNIIYKEYYNMFNNKSNTKTKSNNLIKLNHQFMIPGDEFNESYYWDLYFQIDTLIQLNLYEFIYNLLENFIQLINELNYIPNANRTYFDRSQPPIFGLIIEKIYINSINKKKIPKKIKLIKNKCFKALEKEYNYWMTKRIINIKGYKLNIYKTKSNKPRLEQIDKDFKLYLSTKSINIFNEIKAATESGWDFSSRWESEKNNLLSINTSSFIPVDLNSILFKVEKILFYQTNNIYYKINYKQRKKAMDLFLKNNDYFADYNYVNKCLNTKYFYFSNLFYFLLIKPFKGNLLDFIKLNGIFTPQGIVASNNRLSNHQWDYVIWPQFQYLIINYLYFIEKNKVDSLKLSIIFLKIVYLKYKNNKIIYENYSVDGSGPSKKGEYNTSKGFAWTHSAILYCISLHREDLIKEYDLFY